MKLQFFRRYWGAGEWKKFSTEVRSSRKYNMLIGLGHLDNVILVGGCQRSGTTLLSRLISQSSEIQSIWQSKDDELDAAYILAGLREVNPSHRYCLQVTYLNDAYKQLLEYQGRYRLIWVLRNPYSVVYSMVYNWRRFPLNELFFACGVDRMSAADQLKFRRYGVMSVPVLRRACYAYLGKVEQLKELKNVLDERQLLVVQYDDLISNGAVDLENIFGFVGLSYESSYSEMIEGGSTLKRSRLSANASRTIGDLCDKAYAELSGFSPEANASGLI